MDYYDITTYEGAGHIAGTLVVGVLTYSVGSASSIKTATTGYRYVSKAELDSIIANDMKIPLVDA